MGDDFLLDEQKNFKRIRTPEKTEQVQGDVWDSPLQDDSLFSLDSIVGKFCRTIQGGNGRIEREISFRSFFAFVDALQEPF